MAFDGVTIAAVVSELKTELSGGRVVKIAQPENDELLLTVKTPEGQRRLFLSAGASLPLIYLTDGNKPSPLTAPNFCMLLRKHLQGGRIVGISQPGLERIVHIELEHLDEMGDLRRKTLVVEIMGKHSNIIFCDENQMIIDSIKHISAAVSSVREVLPGRPYFIAATQNKLDLLSTPRETYKEALFDKAQPLYKAVYGTFTGISPVLAQELVFRAGLDGDSSTAACDEDGRQRLCDVLTALAEDIRAERFRPCIAYEGKNPAEFAAVPLTMYDRRDEVGDHLVYYDSISKLLEAFYAEKDALARIRQKSAELRHIVQTALERNVKKMDLQQRQMRDTEKREKYRVYGELLNAYGYGAAPGAKSIEAVDYYTNTPVNIPLDENLSATENAKRYFEKYNKLKRTYEALSKLMQEVQAEIEHLESVAASLDIALHEEDLVQIREELIQSGYIRRRGPQGKKARVTSKPFHYVSSDGFDIYVGKNNFQNDELTFKFATGNDWWFHAKGLPGSHVVVKCDGAEELPDRTFEEAGRLAAYYSKARGSDKVEIDYIQKKHVKKPNGAKPGFVVYYTNYSLVARGDIDGIRLIGE